MPVDGEVLPFEDYLAKNRRKRTPSVVWRWRDLDVVLAAAEHGERGTIALADPNGTEPATIASGISATVQVVNPGSRTAPHAHSFWHFYIVRSGTGLAILDDDKRGRPIAAGDLLFIPAWGAHSFSNTNMVPLVLLALQNLPQAAQIGSLARKERDDSMTIVYALQTDAER